MSSTGHYSPLLFLGIFMLDRGVGSFSKSKEGRLSEIHMYHPKLNAIRVLSVVSRHTRTSNDITQYQPSPRSGKGGMKKPDSRLPLKSYLYARPLEIHSQNLREKNAWLNATVC